MKKIILILGMFILLSSIFSCSSESLNNDLKSSSADDAEIRAAYDKRVGEIQETLKKTATSSVIIPYKENPWITEPNIEPEIKSKLNMMIISGKSEIFRLEAKKDTRNVQNLSVSAQEANKSAAKVFAQAYAPPQTTTSINEQLESQLQLLMKYKDIYELMEMKLTIPDDIEILPALLEAPKVIIENNMLQFSFSAAIPTNKTNNIILRITISGIELSKITEPADWQMMETDIKITLENTLILSGLLISTNTYLTFSDSILRIYADFKPALSSYDIDGDTRIDDLDSIEGNACMEIETRTGSLIKSEINITGRIILVRDPFFWDLPLNNPVKRIRFTFFIKSDGRTYISLEGRFKDTANGRSSGVSGNIDRDDSLIGSAINVLSTTTRVVRELAGTEFEVLNYLALIFPVEYLGILVLDSFFSPNSNDKMFGERLECNLIALFGPALIDNFIIPTGAMLLSDEEYQKTINECLTDSN